MSIVLCLLQELSANDSDDVSGLKRKRHANNKLVIVSDDEDDNEHNSKHDVLSESGNCISVTNSAGPQCTGSYCVSSCIYILSTICCISQFSQNTHLCMRLMTIFRHDLKSYLCCF